jgi:hypothetical protein
MVYSHQSMSEFCGPWCVVIEIVYELVLIVFVISFCFRMHMLLKFKHIEKDMYCQLLRKFSNTLWHSVLPSNMSGTRTCLLRAQCHIKRWQRCRNHLLPDNGKHLLRQMRLIQK